MAKRKSPPTRQIITRVPETLFLEMVAMHPGMIDHEGNMKYGGLQNHILTLILRDVESVKLELRNREIATHNRATANAQEA